MKIQYDIALLQRTNGDGRVLEFQGVRSFPLTEDRHDKLASRRTQPGPTRGRTSFDHALVLGGLPISLEGEVHPPFK